MQRVWTRSDFSASEIAIRVLLHFSFKLLLGIIAVQMRNAWYQSEWTVQTACALNIYQSQFISGTGPFHHLALMRSLCILVINNKMIQNHWEWDVNPHNYLSGWFCNLKQTKNFHKIDKLNGIQSHGLAAHECFIPMWDFGADQCHVCFFCWMKILYNEPGSSVEHNKSTCCQRSRMTSSVWHFNMYYISRPAVSPCDLLLMNCCERCWLTWYWTAGLRPLRCEQQSETINPFQAV